jgi:RNA polymerase sigma-70 factor (ECF subfamily)
MTDEELYRAWCDGDRMAGDQLFRRHFDAVYRFFRRKVREDAAEDLTQGAFVACTAARERFRSDSTFRTFLFAIARNLLFKHYRDTANRPNADFSVTSLHDVGPGPSMLLVERHEQRLLLEGLRRIPFELQVALELHHWEAMTGPELAEVLGIPEGTVRSRLRRAREALRVELEALATSPEVLDSTLTDLDRWAASLRDVIAV